MKVLDYGWTCGQKQMTSKHILTEEERHGKYGFWYCSVCETDHPIAKPKEYELQRLKQAKKDRQAASTGGSGTT